MAIIIAIIGGIFFIILGILYPRFPQPALRKDLAVDILHALVNGILVDIPMAFCLAAITHWMEQEWGARYLGLLQHQSLFVQAVFFIIVGDLVKWTLHMLHHKIPILWRLHRLHHCTQQMDALSHARNHPIEVFINRIVFQTIFVVFAGIAPGIIATYSAVDLLQGLWIHSNTNFRSGWLNYLFSTQEFHHWHHANDAAAFNKNFGGFLSIWDWIFGTAYCPQDKEVASFGVPEIDPPPFRYHEQLLLPFANYDAEQSP